MLIDGAFAAACVEVQAGRIAGILASPPRGSSLGGHRVDLPEDCFLVPGLVDLQVNGGAGLLINDDPSAMRTIAAAHRRLGTTTILPTLITDTQGRMAQAGRAALEAIADPGSGIAGVHFEGPFLNPDRAGVHRRELIREIAAHDVAWLGELAARLPVLLTLAPERVPRPMLAALVGAGVVLSVGHSAASYEQGREAFEAGVAGATHLFNAMPPIVARAPGIAAAALAHGAYCGVIADGHHVHPAMLRLALAANPRLFLVSDAMACAGTDLTAFSLQGRDILRRDGCLRTEDGTLAGADLDLAGAVRYCVRTLGIGLESAVAMASTLPAEFMGLADRGRIAPGQRADFTLLDRDLHPVATWVDGRFYRCGATPGSP